MLRIIEQDSISRSGLNKKRSKFFIEPLKRILKEDDNKSKTLKLSSFVVEYARKRRLHTQASLMVGTSERILDIEK